jgi:hypothetical protein
MEQTYQDDARRIAEQVADPRLILRWRYFMGDHPRIWATPKIERAFRNIADSMTENYCSLAITTRLNRLQIEGWTGPGSDQAEGVWTASRLAQRQDRLFRWALVHGVAYLVVDGIERTLHPNPATLVSGIPDPDEPDRFRVAGKILPLPEGGSRATLWYPDRTVFLDTNSEGVWVQREDEIDQPLGQVPVLPVSPYADGPVLLDQIRSAQDRVNKITSNKMVAAEFGAFRQRVFFTRQDIQPFDVRQEPDHAIVLDPGDADGRAAVQELEATDLDNYDKAKSAEIDSLFTIASLPRHMRVNPGSPPSGDAIKADEGPLVEAVKDHQREAGEALISAMRLLDLDVEPIWRDPEVHDDLTNAQVVAAMVGAGIPWQVAAAKHAGYSPDEIAQAEQAGAATQGNAVGAAILSAFNNPTLAVE